MLHEVIENNVVMAECDSEEDLSCHQLAGGGPEMEEGQ